ncbi:MAG: hypothetical protein J3K34DRAFT_50907 [Monoraphidium minutum]|nr:MAG: hypothetical protein J3K34DRAFT_50907 [Monoraphidium minutum]
MRTVAGARRAGARECRRGRCTESGDRAAWGVSPRCTRAALRCAAPRRVPHHLQLWHRCRPSRLPDAPAGLPLAPSPRPRHSDAPLPARALRARAPRRVGQGLRGADGNMLGASERLLSLQNSYSAAMAQAESLRAAWKSTLRPACRAASKTLCGTGNFESDQARDALMLAASPQAFDSRDPSEMGGFNPISPPGDQGDCNACVAFSIAAAAEAAVASVLRTGALGARTPRLSPRDLFFCGATGAEADCLYGWTFNQALAELAVRKQPLASWKCLPFEDVEDLPVSQLCKPLCAAPTSAPGAFSWTKLQPLVTISRVQQHIRDWGGVVTRLNLQPPFRGWFQGANRTAVYGGFPEDPSTEQGHAVLVVGYNNADNYWVIKNSWGTNWADGGFAKVRALCV